MIYVWATLLLLVNATWLLLTLLGLPGNWLMVAGTVALAWWQHDQAMFSSATLVVIVVIAALAELGEFGAGVFGAQKAGAGKAGAWGALLGAMAGGIIGTVMIPLPLIGSLVGAGGGACLGAWTLELARGRKMGPSVKAGVGAGLGRLTGTVIKLAAGVLIWIITAVAAFWP